MGCVPFGSFDAKERTIENLVICSSLQTFQLEFQDAFCHQLLADILQIFRFMIQQLHLLRAVLCCRDLRGALDKPVSIHVFTGITMQSGRRSSAVCGGIPKEHSQVLRHCSLPTKTVLPRALSVEAQGQLSGSCFGFSLCLVINTVLSP